MTTSIVSVSETESKIQVNGLDALTFNSAGDVGVRSINGGQLAGLRNRIINGGMQVDQRNSGASVVDSTGASPYVVDRWQVISRAGATVTSQQAISGGGSSRRHLAVTATAAKTPATTDQFRVSQAIEGLNSRDLWIGTGDAKTVTLSFESCHSVTGTFSGALFNSAFNRSFVFTYVQNAANTWESKFVTIPLDTTGTWAIDNTVGLHVSFDYGSGSAFQTAAVGSWQVGLFLRSSSATTLISTAGAIFRLQAVQLELGPVATSFEHRPYGMELALCQRYYTSLAKGQIFHATGLTSGVSVGLSHQVSMRTSPSISTSIVDANFSTAGSPPANTWGLQIVGVGIITKTGTAGISFSADTDRTTLYIYAATFSSASNALYLGAGMVINASAEL